MRLASKISATQIKNYLVPLLLITIGALFRFVNFESKVVFYGDHARDLLTTLKIVKLGEIVWHGPAASVTWNLLSPIYYYLLLPFYLIGNWHPLTQPVVTDLLSLFTIILLYSCLKNLWGFKAGLFGSLLYAVSYFVIYDNSIGLNPGFVPPATVLLVWSFVKVLQGRDKYLWLSALALGWTISFHASSFFIIPPLLILMVIIRPKISRSNWIKAGLVFFCLAIIPYGIQEKKFAGYNITTVYNYFFSRDKTAKALAETVPLVTSLKNYATVILKTPGDVLTPNIYPLTLVVSVVFWLTLIYVILIKRKQADLSFQRAAVIFLLYLLFFGLLVRFGTAERPNWWFSNIIFPILVMVVAYFVTLLKNRFLFMAILLIVSLVNLVYLNRQTNDYSFVRYRDEKEIALTLLVDAKEQNFDFQFFRGDHLESGALPPFITLFWYYDKPQFQDRFFRWLNWNKVPSKDLAYLLFENSSPGFTREQILNYQKNMADINEKLFIKTKYYEIYKISKI
ncbi:MAG: glycosyltransferase family 39 protein [candidate division WWE3 bacterium]|nr:glycosyltransferase family 39 protein [candidate division WWE3 bacterium]